MTTHRSLFTEAIEEHLALKKQNAQLEANMPLARFDVGDPLDRYPGGPIRDEDTPSVAIDVDGAPSADAFTAPAADTTQVFDGPLPEQVIDAAHAVDADLARPFEPLMGMAPMLSLVTDVDDDDAVAPAAGTTGPQEAVAAASVLRFPGGVGPRDEAFDAMPPQDTQLFDAVDAHTATAVADMPTGEHPVITVDADAPFASMDAPLVAEPFDAAPEQSRTKRPRFFGIARRRKNKQDAAEQTDGWFTGGPRDFNWE
jgi:hypothetical protein